MLQLFAPDECSYGVNHNDEDGGVVEVIHREHEKVCNGSVIRPDPIDRLLLQIVRLREMLNESRKAEEEARLKVAMLEANALK